MKKSDPSECARSKCARPRVPGSDLCAVCVTKCSRCERKLEYADNTEQVFVGRLARHPLSGDDFRYRKCQRCRDDAANARMNRTDEEKRAHVTSLKKYKKAHPEKVREQNERYRDGLRKRVIEHYGQRSGGGCVCCGETNPRLLTLGHVNEDGAEHRATIGSGGMNIMLWAVKNQFPDTLQLECFNCNFGRKLNGGVCPHQDDPAPSQKKPSCSQG